MSIYKSSFNKTPEKKEKKEKPVKEKIKVKSVKIHFNINIFLIVLFSVLFIFSVCPDNFMRTFLLGSFGLLVYPLLLIGITLSAVSVKKRLVVANKKLLAYFITAFVLFAFIIHLITTSQLNLTSFGAYLKETYLAGTTAGGVIFSLISYFALKYLTIAGSFIFSGIALAIFVGLITDYFVVQRNLEDKKSKVKFDFADIEDFESSEPVIEESIEEKKKKLACKKLGLDKSDSSIISSSMPSYDVDIQNKSESTKRDYILTPLEPIIPPKSTNEVFSSNASRTQINNFDTPLKSNSIYNEINETVKPETKEEVYNNFLNNDSLNTEAIKHEVKEADDIFVDDDDLNSYSPAFETNVDELNYNELEDLNENYLKKPSTPSVEENTIEETDNTGTYETNKEEINEILSENDNLDEVDNNDYEDNPSIDDENVEEITPNLDEQDYVDEFTPKKYNLGETIDSEVVRPSVDLSKFNLPNITKKTLVEDEPKIVKQKENIPPYVVPPVDLLHFIENKSSISDEELQNNIDRLEQVLEDFKVPAKVNNVQVGPAVTRYELTMPRGISVNKIAQMADDIAMTLASNGAIRVEAPIPGKTSVGIEVPNNQISPVSLRELIDSEEFRQRGNPLSFVLGKDINGDIVFCNLDKMPHMLVAGSTGSGKSVCLNTMLLSMCYKAGPQDLRLILVDPKMVEFTTYNGLPHLLIPEVITNKDMTINALDWAIVEMERRYTLFAENHVNGIADYNRLEIVKTKQVDKLPFIVIVIDELADLMSVAKREIEDRIARLAAKARAAGIHLVLATQRPSVDVITGTVKANLPSRIAFALTNYMDSKTVLDGGGAEKLLGKGDMLFKPQDKPEPRRVQGAFVSNEEIQAVVNYIKDNNKPVYDDETGDTIKNAHKSNANNIDNKDIDFDPVLKDALRMFIQTKQASGSMISRRYSVGFNRAGRIMDQMELAGFIGPQEGSKPRRVLITMEEFKEIFGDDDEF